MIDLSCIHMLVHFVILNANVIISLEVIKFFIPLTLMLNWNYGILLAYFFVVINGVRLFPLVRKSIFFLFRHSPFENSYFHLSFFSISLSFLTFHFLFPQDFT